jgi:uncharacterized coiled-coil protein SlyX
MSVLSQLRSSISENRLTVAGITCLGLMVIGAIVAAEHYADQADDLSLKAKVLEGRLVETDTQRLMALNGMDEARAWASAANARVIELEARLSKKPYPPKPKPAPETNKELETVIVKFGLADGLSVLDSTSPSTLGRPDALKVYEWASQAARVAPLEDRLSASEALIGGLKTEVSAKDTEVKATFTALSKTTDQLILTKEQAKVFQQQAQATAKKAKVQKWLYLGGGLLTGYLVSKK